MPPPDPILRTALGPLRLTNPFLPAAGPPAASGNQIRHAVIDRNRCTGCSLCSWVCPKDAIVMQVRRWVHGR